MDRQSLSRLLDMPLLPEYLSKIDDGLRSLAEKTVFKEILIKRFESGGKRLRPAILIAAASANGRKIDAQVISAATAVELIHQASLFHDQITDEHSPMAMAELLLAGDFLLAAGLSQAADAGGSVAKLLAQAVMIMADGQAAQLKLIRPAKPPDPTYIQIVINKTASLFSVAAQIGALGGQFEKNFKNYGLNFGIAFQITDDIIDGEVEAKEDAAVSYARKYMSKAAQSLNKLGLKKASGLAKLPDHYLKVTLGSRGL